MVPCCDMANHASRPSARYEYSGGGDCFQLVAARAIPAGQEACISYGCVGKSNAELMRDYGFVLAANLNDRVDFQAAAAEDVLSVLRGGGRGGPAAGGGPRASLDAGRLMAALGITCSAGNQLTGDCAPDALLAADDEPTVARRRRVVTLLSLRPFLRRVRGAAAGEAPPPLGEAELQAERRSVEALRERCRSSLAAMPTSAAADEALLAAAAGGEVLGARLRQAVVARLEVKRVLEAADEALGGYASTL
jgi:hypothetical protein